MVGNIVLKQIQYLHLTTLDSDANVPMPDSASTWNAFGREGQIGSRKLSLCTRESVSEGSCWIPPAHNAGCCILEWGHWRGDRSVSRHGSLGVKSILRFLSIISTTTLFISFWVCPQVMEDRTLPLANHKPNECHQLPPKVALVAYPHGRKSLKRHYKSFSLISDVLLYSMLLANDLKLQI